MKLRHKFNKKFRLLSDKNFNFVFKNPKIFIFFNFIILSRNNNEKYPRLGLIVKKKQLDCLTKETK